MAILINTPQQFIKIVDLADRRDGKTAKMGLYQQGLRLKVRDTADSKISLHLFHITLEFRTERRVLNVVDRTVESSLAVCCHTSSSGSKMRVIIYSIKKF